MVKKKKKKKGRPPKEAGARKEHFIQVRVAEDEKQAFSSAADLAGIDVSTWVRERLRIVARTELEEGRRQIEFLKEKPQG